LSFGNLIAKTDLKRTASLGTAGNPFSLITQTDTDTVNGRVYTSTFTASNRTYTDTSPAVRQQPVTLDTKERIATTLPDGLTINHIYDANGNLTAITPPGKSVHDFSYYSINLPSS
jgi:hypothetical protein